MSHAGGEGKFESVGEGIEATTAGVNDSRDQVGDHLRLELILRAAVEIIFVASPGGSRATEIDVAAQAEDFGARRAAGFNGGGEFSENPVSRFDVSNCVPRIGALARGKFRMQTTVHVKTGRILQEHAGAGMQVGRPDKALAGGIHEGMDDLLARHGFTVGAETRDGIFCFNAKQQPWFRQKRTSRLDPMMPWKSMRRSITTRCGDLRSA